MKITIIGAGSAGYTAAIEGAKKGFEVILIEKDKLGGVCLNYGCIPTKSILASADLIRKIKESKKFAVNSTYYFEYFEIIERKNKIVEKLRSDLDFLISLNKINIKKGNAEIINKNTVKVGEEEIKTDMIILATGSKQKEMGVKGIFPEQVFLKENVFDKNKKINILGAGFIGCEFANILSCLDFKVNLFEKESRIFPFLEKEVSEIIRENLVNQGVCIKTDYLIEKDKEFIVCAGRQANIPFSNIFIEKKEDFIKVDENLKTNVDNIYAIGDVNGNCLLASWAMAEAKRVINFLDNKESNIDFESCPNVIFTNPEIAFFGKEKPNYQSAKSYFKINSKALVDSSEQGFIKLFINEENVLKAGIIVGEKSSEMINQLSFFYNKNIDEIKNKIFFHPSLSELILNVLEKFK